MQTKGELKVFDMKKLYYATIFVIILAKFHVLQAVPQDSYERIWLRSRNSQRTIMFSSLDEKTYKGVKIKGLRLKHPNKKRCSQKNLDVLERDLELNMFMKELVGRSKIEAKDIKVVKRYPFCKKYHMYFAALSKAFHEDYEIVKIESVPKKKGKWFSIFTKNL